MVEPSRLMRPNRANHAAVDAATAAAMEAGPQRRTLLGSWIKTADAASRTSRRWRPRNAFGRDPTLVETAWPTLTNT